MMYIMLDVKRASCESADSVSMLTSSTAITKDSIYLPGNVRTALLSILRERILPIIVWKGLSEIDRSSKMRVSSLVRLAILMTVLFARNLSAQRFRLG